MTVLATDLFNRGDAGLGAEWTTITGRSNPQIVTQQVRDEALGGSSADALYTNITWPDDQYAQIVIAQCFSATKQVGVLLRGITASRTYYLIDITGPLDATATYRLLRLNAGAASTLVAATTTTVAVNDVLYCEIVGYTVVAKLNGTTLFTYDDSADGSKLTSGSPGITVSCGDTSLAHAILDDFQGGDFASTPITGLRPSMRVPNVLVF